MENRWLIFLVLDACRLLIVVSRRRTKRGQCGEAWRASKRAKRSEMHSGSGKSERTGDVCGNSVNLAGNHGRVNRVAAPFSLLLCRGEREREESRSFFSGPKIGEKRFTMISAKGNRIRILRSRLTPLWYPGCLLPRYLRRIFNDPGPGLRLMASLTLNEHLRQL